MCIVMLDVDSSTITATVLPAWRNVDLCLCCMKHTYCLFLYLFSMLSIVLTEKIEELGEELRSHFNIEEFSPVSLPVQVQAQTLSWTDVNSAVCDYAF